MIIALVSISLSEKCLYSEFFWSVFSLIQTEYGDIVRIRENKDQKNSEYGHFSRSVFKGDKPTLSEK